MYTLIKTGAKFSTYSYKYQGELANLPPREFKFRRFYCANGPRAGMYLDKLEAEELGYKQFNRAGNDTPHTHIFVLF